MRAGELSAGGSAQDSLASAADNVRLSSLSRLGFNLSMYLTGVGMRGRVVVYARLRVLVFVENVVKVTIVFVL